MLRIACIGLLTALVCWMATGCFEEEFTMSPDARLEFSLDTLRFDTVFTELGSATRSFRVFNPNAEAVRISRVRLDDEASKFRLNVDGFQGTGIEDVEIVAGDSIWVFVEVTVDPDQPVSNSPFVIEDRVLFTLNDQDFFVRLEAWGQNANYVPGPGQGNAISILSCDLQSETWGDPKPYVIYGTLIIDSCTLIWPPGTEIYIHGGLADNQLGQYNDGIIFTLPDGRIQSRGTLEEPVLLRDDRTEPEFDGIWGGLRLGPASGPHTFEYTTIRNATTALGVDSAAIVTLTGCQIYGNSGSGLFARNASVTAINSLIYDNAGSAAALTFGGTYNFDYVTLASYGNASEGLVVNDFFCLDPLCSQGAFVSNLSARFRNCIIAGSSGDEISITNAGAELPELQFDLTFENCVVTVNELLDPDNYPDFFEALCNNCVDYNFGDTLFVDPFMEDYHLDSLSIAEERAMAIPGITDDLDGVIRDLSVPDIGCFEYQ